MIKKLKTIWSICFLFILGFISIEMYTAFTEVEIFSDKDKQIAFSRPDTNFEPNQEIICSKDCITYELIITKEANIPLIPDRIILNSKRTNITYQVSTKSFFEGVYRLDIPKDEYEVVISKKGFHPHKLILSENDRIKNIQVTMESKNLTSILSTSKLYQYKTINKKENFISISGYITDNRFRPIENVKISVNDYQNGEKNETLSDTKGFYTLEIPFNKAKGIQQITLTYSHKLYHLNYSTVWSDPKSIQKQGNIILEKLTSRFIDNSDLNPQPMHIVDNSVFISQKMNVENTALRVGVNCGGGKFSCTRVISTTLGIYIRNVLSNEWVPNWGNFSGADQCFASGAVVIRSYALDFKENPLTRDYDICNTTACQVYDPSDDSGNTITNTSVTSTTNWVLIDDRGTYARTEFAAETNDLVTNPDGCNYPYKNECGDGKFQKSILGPPCNGGGCYPNNERVDYVSLGKINHGHSRGLSQRGSFRWATGYDVSRNNIVDISRKILPANHKGFEYCDKSWQEIIANYFPYFRLYNTTSDQTISLSTGFPNGINSCNGNTGGDNDTIAPTTSVSISGGNTQSGDFTTNFDDKDNVAVTRRYYIVLEKYGDQWYTNRTKGFFNDDFNTDYGVYTKNGGTWNTRSGRMFQSNASSTNTGLIAFVAQNSELPYMYEFNAKVVSTSGPKKFGIHIMADNAQATQSGNSYLIWFNGEANRLELYKTVNNALNTRATATVVTDNNLNNYKITYSPAFGVIEIWKNNKSVLRWVDPTPIKTGNYISLRTNQTQAEFDILSVFRYRATSSVPVTAGSQSTKDLRRKNGRITTYIRDEAGNWSLPKSADVLISTLSRQNESILNDTQLLGEEMILYPNPTDGNTLSLSFPTNLENIDMKVSIVDINGKVLGEQLVKNKSAGTIDVSNLVKPLAKGMYFVKMQSKTFTKIMQLLKN